MRLAVLAATLVAFVAAQSAEDLRLAKEELLARRNAILRRTAIRPRQFSRPVILATGEEEASEGPRRIKLTNSRPAPVFSTSRRRRVQTERSDPAVIQPNNYPPLSFQAPSVPDRPPTPFTAPAAPVIQPAAEIPASAPVQFGVPAAPQPPAPQVPTLTAEQLRQVPNIGPVLRRAAGLLGFQPGSPVADAIPQDTRQIAEFFAAGLPGGNPASIPGALAYPQQPSAGSLSPSFFGAPAPVAPAAPSFSNGLAPDASSFPLPAQAQVSSPLLDIFKTISRNSGLANFFQSNPQGVQIPGLDALLSARTPPVPGLPRIPGLPLLPEGLPRDPTGQVDVLRLAQSIGSRFTQGRTVSDYFPPDRIQSLADNVTESLLPVTANVQLEKMMGRWFEGLNTPDASNEKCIVHHYGGLSSTGSGDKNVKTFSALKIFREGSEFGQVRYSIGFAFRGGHRKGMLQFHYSGSEGSEPQPYWVYKVGPEVEDALGQTQYEYAIVSNWIKYPFNVLVRDPDTFKEKYEVEVLRWLEDNNFINSFTTAFNLVQPTDYSSCQYSKSTYKVLG